MRPHRRYRHLSIPISDSHGQTEMLQRSSSAQDGSERLCDAIEDLVKRTAARLEIPAQFSGRKLAFARAYMGMEV